MAISQSSTLAKLSGGTPAVVTLFRGAISLPFIWFIARREGHTANRRDRLLAVGAGALFALDLQCFHINQRSRTVCQKLQFSCCRLRELAGEILILETGSRPLWFVHLHEKT